MNVNHRLKLTVSQVKHAKPSINSDGKPTSKRLQDGNGLMLLVKPSGSRSWVQRIVIQGKRVDIGLGAWPLTSLAEARDMAFENRRIARRGGDPRMPVSTAPTFRELAGEVHREVSLKNAEVSLKNAVDRRKWINELTLHAFPSIGDRPVDQITKAEVKSMLMPIWCDKPTVAKRVAQRCAIIFRRAIFKDLRLDNPADSKLLEDNMPKNGNGAHKTHYKALPHQAVSGAIATVRGSQAHTEAVRLGFEFLVLTAVRSHEVRGARWSEIDMKGATWTIPADRMKAGKEHVVPLSDGAMRVLKRAADVLTQATGKHSDLVFGGIHDKAFPVMMKDLGIDAVPHGFRSSFRDWASRPLKENAGGTPAFQRNAPFPGFGSGL